MFTKRKKSRNIIICTIPAVCEHCERHYYHIKDKIGNIFISMCTATLRKEVFWVTRPMEQVMKIICFSYIACAKRVGFGWRAAYDHRCTVVCVGLNFTALPCPYGLFTAVAVANITIISRHSKKTVCRPYISMWTHPLTNFTRHTWGLRNTARRHCYNRVQNAGR